MNWAEVFRNLKMPYTMERDAILRILESAAVPLSPREIHKMLPEPRASLTTVYRNLALMERMGIVRCVELRERFRRYKLVGKSGAHEHHVVCRNCGRIDTVQPDPCSLQPFLSDIHDRLGYQVLDHSLEFFGLCPMCK
ncbi:MAG: transcriptional repressor [Deltaproteobacteria bacterium]|nr:transcriptional repressor [Deltaproteobacteria bacterium]MBW2305366.1 transcriptional repressor [Deltaproteobacteria bacterium]